MHCATLSPTTTHTLSLIEEVIRTKDPALIATDAGSVVILPNFRFREMEEKERELAYILKLLAAIEDVQNGNVVVKTMDELEAMEKDT